MFATNAAMTLREKGIPTTRFVGYERLEETATVLAIVGEGDRFLDSISGGAAEVRIVLDGSPFYAQGGGQVGDRGVLKGPAGEAEVQSTSPLDGYHLHLLSSTNGTLKVGDTVTASVDTSARRATERNHTATHLLHAALKNVVGEHVSQAGSEVSPERLRFDYTHGDRLTEAQLRAIEDEVCGIIMTAEAVVPAERGLDEARAAGFVAMFGEKYGDTVRTLSVGEYSKELCGGTHVSNSGAIGPFRIVSDSAVSAGTRRIEAITGQSALEATHGERAKLASTAKLLKAPQEEVETKLQALVDEVKQLRKDLAKATAADLGKLVDDLFAAAQTTPDGTRTAVFECPGITMKEAQELLTRAKQKASTGWAGVVLVPGDAEVLVAAGVSPDLTDRVRAGDLVKELTGILGGGGGGRPELAQGKGRDRNALPAAAAKAKEMLASALG